MSGVAETCSDLDPSRNVIGRTSKSERHARWSTLGANWADDPQNLERPSANGQPSKPKHTELAALTCSALFASAAGAENVEIYLVDMLDTAQSGFCIDIARAQGDAAKPDDGLQGHTCCRSMGEQLVDQIFDSAQFAEGAHCMLEFDVCA